MKLNWLELLGNKIKCICFRILKIIITPAEQLLALTLPKRVLETKT